MMSGSELQDLLIKESENMPRKARRVVDYLLSDMREASFRSIGDIAEDLKVSKAQLVRVAQLLGFSGYAELKQCMQKAILEQINPAALLAKAKSSDSSFADSISTVEHANLNDTLAQLSQEDTDMFCNLVKDARNIYCVGWGISSLVMDLMAIRLNVMGCKATLLRRSSLSLWEQARCIGEGDLVIVCELPSYTVEVTESVGIAKENGAKIITITDSAAVTVCRYADLSFYVSADSPTFGSSIIGPIYLVNILTSELSLALGEQAAKSFEKQAEFLHDERIFHPIFGLKY